MGKILSFIGGCIAGVVGVFAVAVMSEMTPNAESSENSDDAGEQNGVMETPEIFRNKYK